jgi:hypothetical protein
VGRAPGDPGREGDLDGPVTIRTATRHPGVTLQQAAPHLDGSTGQGAGYAAPSSVAPGPAPAPVTAALVVVPRSPGPVRPVDPERRRKDDLDEAIDEMFGPTPEDGPGWFDASLVIVGAGLLAWGLVPGGNAGLVPWGIIAIVHGSVLPARTLLRRVRARSVGRRLRTAARDGYLLDVSHPDVKALVDRYEQCLALAPGSMFEIDIQVAAHQAMVEVATLLDGAAPTTPQELRYIQRRIQAMEVLEDRLRGDEEARGGAVDGRAVRAEALEELEEASGNSSVGQLQELGELVLPSAQGATHVRRVRLRPRRLARPAGRSTPGADSPGPDGTAR